MRSCVCVRLLQGPPPVSHILTFLVQQEPHSASNLTGFSQTELHFSCSVLSLMEGWYFTQRHLCEGAAHRFALLSRVRTQSADGDQRLAGEERLPAAAERGCRKHLGGGTGVRLPPCF